MNKNEPPYEKETIRDRLAEHFGDDLVFANSFDTAIIGVSIGNDTGRVVYDANEMAKVLIERDGMTPEEAWEFLEYNTFCAYVGVNTPIYVERNYYDDQRTLQ